MHAQAVGSCRGMTKAVVADGAQSDGQHVTAVAAEELNPRDSFCFPTAVIGPIFPAESDGGIGEGEKARVVNGGAGNVSAEVFDGGSTGARRLDVNAPVFIPNGRIDWPAVFFKELVEVLTEGALQVGQINQELVVFHLHILAFGIESGARDQTVNVRMELQELIPGMQDGGEAADGGPQCFVLSEFFAQGTRHGGEEQVVSFFGERAEEAAAQLCERVHKCTANTA